MPVDFETPWQRKFLPLYMSKIALPMPLVCPVMNILGFLSALLLKLISLLVAFLRSPLSYKQNMVFFWPRFYENASKFASRQAKTTQFLAINGAKLWVHV